MVAEVGSKNPGGLQHDIWSSQSCSSFLSWMYSFYGTRVSQRRYHLWGYGQAWSAEGHSSHAWSFSSKTVFLAGLSCACSRAKPWVVDVGPAMAFTDVKSRGDFGISKGDKWNDDKNARRVTSNGTKSVPHSRSSSFIQPRKPSNKTPSGGMFASLPDIIIFPPSYLRDGVYAGRGEVWQKVGRFLERLHEIEGARGKWTSRTKCVHSFRAKNILRVSFFLLSRSSAKVFEYIWYLLGIKFSVFCVWNAHYTRYTSTFSLI